ncbi:hypothetical protein DSM19430T_03520 [Desulfovibrio psychrotolerans]|uniref:Uncharacterized protein n=1 Tax=Desulfovibrio psychrotolerans TaxID=415242 RepID=A0A7J0BPW5_9BACT|nr:hypothetical protein DSM19430T_03520 [Desulfovibrio psychrotolerans]
MAAASSEKMRKALNRALIVFAFSKPGFLLSVHAVASWLLERQYASLPGTVQAGAYDVARTF